MKTDSLYYVAAGVLSLAWLITPHGIQAARSRNLNISFEGNAEHCADLQARSEGELARAAESFTLARNEAPILEIADTAGRSIVRVRGWDRPEYSVEACKFAAAPDRPAAEQLLRGIAVSRTAGRFSATGPSAAGEASWQLYFIVHAPRNASLDLETRNGPISVAEVSGSVKARATNGPLSIRDCAGTIDVHTSNGPISFSGGSGEVHLNAQNGPISLKLSGDNWNGPVLEARTVNGPVSLEVPEAFHSGIRVESSGHSPVSCRLEACRAAWTNPGSDQRVLQLNGAQDVVRVSSSNGPISIHLPKPKGRQL